ncbi:carboxymuconolactone decarboxylase family protein [Agarilytica rhodophyticola]|uniref:carboxymuconolactone decarboxylase family protein n=1 Tax=Agarilytica rhodophyticola TaxID=1737490 RepID=UPI000B34647A|nr:carboxymuconolactone decarboxylase family protein [Agarilytica rhodophyticola]
MTPRMTYKDMPAEIYAGLLKLEKTVSDIGLDKRVLHLIKILASNINGCAFCLDMHAKEAFKDGMDAKDIYMLPVWREAPNYSKKEKAILHWVETLTLVSEKQVPNAIFEEMASYFDKSTIGKITLSVLTINSWNRMILAIGTVPGTYQVKD